MISHSFSKIAASDDGNFILSLREAEAKAGWAGGRKEGARRGRNVWEGL